MTSEITVLRQSKYNHGSIQIIFIYLDNNVRKQTIITTMITIIIIITIPRVMTTCPINSRHPPQCEIEPL